MTLSQSLCFLVLSLSAFTSGLHAAEEARAKHVLIVSFDQGGHDFKDHQGNTRGTHGDATPDDVTIPWVNSLVFPEPHSFSQSHRPD
jgi:hypothetical protein